MGFFSWITADTNESISNIYSERETFPVYVLRPDGAPPIEERAYEGYGRFGGHNIYALLAEWNFGDSSLDELAITLDCGNVFFDNNGVPYLSERHWTLEGIKKVFQERPIVAFSHFDSIIEHFGCSVNDAIDKGLLIPRDLPIKFPIKIVRDPTLRYEDVPASEHCEAQGFFYEWL